MNASGARRAAAAAVAGAMILTAAPQIAAAEVPATTSTAVADDQRTFATIVVNGAKAGEQILLVKSNGVYVSLAGLRAVGLVIPPRFEGSAPARYVNVNDLAPEIVAVFDLNGPTLRLDASTAGSLSQRSSISFAPEENPAREALAPKSGYLNYALRAGSAGLSGAEELTLSDSAKTFFSAGTLDAHGFHRSLTNLTWTSALARRRTMIGDVVADSGDLGSAMTITGVSVARASEIDPDGQPYTSPTLRSTVLTPSTADVYVNGQLIRSVDVAPGTVDFSNLPGAAGVTDATIVLRDAFGRTQTLSTRYYGAPSVLSKGTTDYSFAAGAARNALGAGSVSGSLVALGRYRLGVTRSITIGAHAEFSGGFENLGATLDHAGSLGAWRLSLAQSRDRGASGTAGSLTYDLGTRNGWVNATIHAATPAYTSIAQRAFADRTIRNEQVSFGIRPFRGSFTSAITFSASRSALGTASRSIAWQQSMSLPGGVSLMVAAGTTATNLGSRHDLSIFLYRSAPRTSSVPTVNASLQTYGAALRQALEVQRAAPPSGGSGYDVTGFASGPTLSSGRFETRSPAGIINVDYDAARGGPITGNVAASGAIAFAGRYLHVSQPISDSFAIVKVDGGERVKVSLDHQEAGMSDRSGFLVIAHVPSYSAQRISIARDDGPVNLRLSNADQRLVLASRHGGVAQFSASVVRAIIGSVAVSGIGGNVTPSFGQLALRSAGKTAVSELDRDGHFYFEDVPAGTYEASLVYGGGDCRFSMDIPRTTAIEANIGEFTCVRS